MERLFLPLFLEKKGLPWNTLMEPSAPFLRVKLTAMLSQAPLLCALDASLQHLSRPDPWVPPVGPAGSSSLESWTGNGCGEVFVFPSPRKVTGKPLLRISSSEGHSARSGLGSSVRVHPLQGAGGGAGVSVSSRTSSLSLGGPLPRSPAPTKRRPPSLGPRCTFLL